MFGIDVEIDTETHSAIQDKIDSDCYFILQKSVLEGLIKRLLCPKCKRPCLSLDLLRESSCGFSTKGKTFCSHRRSFEDKHFFCERVGGSSPGVANLSETKSHIFSCAAAKSHIRHTGTYA